MTCENCQDSVGKVVIHEKALWCLPCHTLSKGVAFGQAPGIATDGIPGGLLIKHGICNEDGTPKRYDSKSEIKRAAFEAGYFVGDDTPRPNARLQDERAATQANKARTS